MRPFLFFLFGLAACDTQMETKLTDSGVMVTDADGDGYASSEDCDDQNPEISPGSEEICDGIDNDCDTEIDTDDGLVNDADSDLSTCDS